MLVIGNSEQDVEKARLQSFSLKKYLESRNCVIPVERVRTLGSVGSRTQLSLRCNILVIMY